MGRLLNQKISLLNKIFMFVTHDRRSDEPIRVACVYALCAEAYNQCHITAFVHQPVLLFVLQ